jgi:hypothetical protein
MPTIRATGDAQATESAINIGDGWDYAIRVPDGGAADNSMAWGDAQDIELWFNGSQLFFDLNPVAETYDFVIDMGNNSASQLVVQNVGFGNSLIYGLRGANDANLDSFDLLWANLAPNTGGGEVINLVNIDLDESDWVAAGTTTLNAININAITADADAVHTALSIGDGWDYAISIPDGGAADNSIVLGDAQDAEIFFDGGELEFNMTAGTNDDVRFVIDPTTNSFFLISDGTNVVSTSLRASAAAKDFMEIDVVVSGNPGANAINMLSLDWNETEFTADAATLSGLNVQGITADASATSYGINIGDGWDEEIHFAGATALIDSDGAITFRATGNTVAVNNGSANLFYVADSLDTIAMIPDGTVANGSLTIIDAGAAGSSTDMASFQFTPLAHDGAGDISTTVHITHVINAGSTAGLNNAIEIASATDEVNTVDSAIYVGAGWDYALTITEINDAADNNPPAGTVGIFLDDSADYSGAGGNDCWLILRDAGGNNHEIVEVVLNGACP